MGFAVCVFSTSDRLFEEQKVVMVLFLANRESVSPSTWARQAFRQAMHAGNSSAWNTVWGLTACSMKRTRGLIHGLTPSTPFSTQEVLAAMFPGPYLWTWSQRWLVSKVNCNLLFYCPLSRHPSSMFRVCV